jgi:hypothetical protein
MLGIVLILIATVVIYIKSAIYAVLFCFQTISFMTDSVQTCLVCPDEVVFAGSNSCADGSKPVNMSPAFSQATLAALFVNTAWFILISKCLCCTRHTKTYDKIFTLCNITMVLSIITTVYSK